MKIARLQELINYHYPKRTLITELGVLNPVKTLQLHKFKDTLPNHYIHRFYDMSNDDLYELASLIACDDPRALLSPGKISPFHSKYFRLSEAFANADNDGYSKLCIFGALKHMNLFTKEYFDRVMEAEDKDHTLFSTLYKRMPFHEKDLDELLPGLTPANPKPVNA